MQKFKKKGLKKFDLMRKRKKGLHFEHTKLKSFGFKNAENKK